MSEIGFRFDLWMVVGIALVGFLLGRMTAKDPVQRERERKDYEAGLRRSKAAMDQSLRDEVGGLLRQRRKIDAIKLVRQRLHIGLKEAKDLVDDIDGNGAI